MLGRRKPLRGGIERAPKRGFPKHERWVRGFACCVPGCQCRQIECMHLRNAANSGTSIKPPSWFCIPGCSAHHHEAHQIGHDSFALKYGIDLWKIAADLAYRTTDKTMRDEMRRVGA